MSAKNVEKKRIFKSRQQEDSIDEPAPLMIDLYKKSFVESELELPRANPTIIPPSL